MVEIYNPSESGVTTINGLDGDVILAAGTNITLNEVGNTITINSTGGSGVIPELTSDPVSPTPEEAWVLKSGSGGTRKFSTSLLPLGMVLASSGGTIGYQFSYYTLEGSIKRVSLT